MALTVCHAEPTTLPKLLWYQYMWNVLLGSASRSNAWNLFGFSMWVKVFLWRGQFGVRLRAPGGFWGFSLDIGWFNKTFVETCTRLGSFIACLIQDSKAFIPATHTQTGYTISWLMYPQKVMFIVKKKWLIFPLTSEYKHLSTPINKDGKMSNQQRTINVVKA